MQRNLRVGIVGFGFIGKVHGWAHENLKWYYDSLPVATEITHVATTHDDSARAAQALTGAAHASTDPASLCESPEVDLVHICTPNDTHAELVRKALSHGKYVYCDKPLVTSWQEAQALQAEFPHELEYNIGMTFQWRFLPATLRAAQFIRRGGLGRVLSFRASYLHSGSADPEAPLKWKLSGEAGGGVIADLGSHIMDLIAALGGRYQSISAHTSTAFDTRPAPGGQKAGERLKVDAEDQMIAVSEVLFPGSDRPALGTIEASKIATGTEDELRFEIHGTDGALRFNSMTPHYLEFYDARGYPNQEPDDLPGGLGGWNALHTGRRYEEAGATFPTPKASIGWLRSHVACLAESVTAFGEGRPPQPNGLDGLYAQQVMEAVRESVRERKPVPVQDRD